MADRLIGRDRSAIPINQEIGVNPASTQDDERIEMPKFGHASSHRQERLREDAQGFRACARSTRWLTLPQSASQSFRSASGSFARASAPRKAARSRSRCQ